LKKAAYPAEIGLPKTETAEGFEDPLTEPLRTGARRLIQQAIEAELAELLAQYERQVNEQGRRAVVRNGYRRSG